MAQAIEDDVLREALSGRMRIVRFSIEQYHEMIGSGAIPEDKRIEMLNGLLVEKDRAKAGDDPMTIGDRHRMAVMRLERLLPQFETLNCFLQCQQPVVVPPNSEPEPDISVIAGILDDFAEHPPTAADTIFVLEVSDSSLRRDLKTKLRIYARGRIPLYIVVDLQHDRVLLHRKPKGDHYSDLVKLSPGETLALPAGAGKHVKIGVDQLI